MPGFYKFLTGYAGPIAAREKKESYINAWDPPICSVIVLETQRNYNFHVETSVLSWLDKIVD